MDIKQVESIPWITHSSATQVLVVGGGPSGVCAAVAAARKAVKSHLWSRQAPAAAWRRRRSLVLL